MVFTVMHGLSKLIIFITGGVNFIFSSWQTCPARKESVRDNLQDNWISNTQYIDSIVEIAVRKSLGVVIGWPSRVVSILSVAKLNNCDKPPTVVRERDGVRTSGSYNR